VLIKWVACRSADRAAFDRGQQAWADLRGVAGFLGQCGGWSRRDGGLAHIFGWWADESSYRTFMAETHDRIAAVQAGSYRSLDVRLFDKCLDIGAGFVADNTRGALLRLAHCHVRAHRQAHFVRAQAEVWNPGMSAAPGMLGGTFAQRGDAEFIVLSQWRSMADHEDYRNNRFMDLRERSGAAEDLDAVTGDLIDLEPKWTVPM
jgi:heme-degrading monooxygenase HmoA